MSRPFKAPSSAAFVTGISRRQLLHYGGIAGVTALMGCGGGGDGAGAPASSTPAPAPTPTPAPAAPPATEFVPSPGFAGTQFGVNCYDLFYKFMWSKAPFNPYVRLKPLRDMGITMVRFSASPFWPTDWKAWEAAREQHLKALDAVFDAADTLGMRLIPTVIWYPGGLSDHCGERYSAWGNPASATRRYMDRHASVVISRYARRSSLMLWEFSNEMNSFADLPNGYKFFPAVNVGAGTFAERTIDDNITMPHIQSAYLRFEALVHSYDTLHPISTGSHIPRENQINGVRGSYALDSKAQLADAMRQAMVSERKILSMHLYDKQVAKRFDAKGTSYAELLSIARATADQAGAKFLLGEFGVPKSGDVAADRTRIQAMIAQIRAAKVDYALIWNYDWDFQADWSITANNGRDWMLEEVAAANRLSLSA